MKKLILLFSVFIIAIGCKDYDAQFDELNKALASLESDNRALESQIAAIQVQDALIAQATAERLGQFQQAVQGIIVALQSLGEASTLTITQVQGIIDAIADLTTLVNNNAENLSSLEDTIAISLAEIQSMLDTINENVLLHHHSGGGSHGSGGTHGSGGSSSSGS